MREQLEKLMERMPIAWVRRWCLAPEFGGCWCQGCANHILIKNGYTYEDWRKYVSEKIGMIDVPTLEEAREEMRFLDSRI